MKTAYELAMERLEAESGPTRRLSDEEKQTLADIDSKYDSQIANVRIQYDAKISAATNHEELAAVRTEMAQEIANLEERREQAKDAVWGEK